MNIAIIDDTATDRALLSAFLNRYVEENALKSDFHIYEFESGEDFFATYTNTMFDILFIDYFMHGMSGMDVAKKVRNTDSNCAIFFTTASPDYAIESFLVKASGYLLKPYKYEDFFQLLNLCDTIKQNIANPFVEYQDGKNNYRLFLSDIISCATSGHYVIVSLKDKEDLRIRSSFDAFSAPLLSYPQFLITCRGYLINMDYVRSVEDCDFVMENNSYIPITKKIKTEIKGTYQKYQFSKTASS